MEVSQNVFDAVKSTSLGDKVNEDELKKLLASEPKIETPGKTLGQIFDPYKWTRSFGGSKE